MARTTTSAVTTTLVDAPAPALFSPAVHVCASRLAFTARPLATAATSEDEALAFDVARAVPTVSRNAVPKRVAEHVAGRYAAARALLLAGLPEGELSPIAIGEGQGPVWPAGFTGAITHGGDHVLAAAARRGTGRGLSIGLDVERVMEPGTARDVFASLCTQAEFDGLRASRDRAIAHPSVRASVTDVTDDELLTLLFSAKESFYKALYPHVGRYFDFLDAHAEAFDPDRGRIVLRLLTSLGAGFDEGFAHEARFVRGGGHVITSFEIRSST